MHSIHSCISSICSTNVITNIETLKRHFALCRQLHVVKEDVFNSLTVHLFLLVSVNDIHTAYSLLQNSPDSALVMLSPCSTHTSWCMPFPFLKILGFGTEKHNGSKQHNLR